MNNPMRKRMTQKEEKNVTAAKCPICNSRIMNLTCPKHGTICETCGTLYKNEISCPNCFPTLPNIQDVSTKDRRIVVPLGELGLGAKELSAITGRQAFSKKEANILRAMNNGVDPKRRKIRQKAEAAIKWLNLPRNTEVELLQTVERNSVTIASRHGKKNSSQNSHISLEKVVEFSLLSEAKKIGKTIVEVQEALAKAGFNIKLRLFSLRICVPKNVDVSLVSMYVNGWKREGDSFRPKFAGEGPLGTEYTVAFQALLSDTIDSEGHVGEHEWVEVRFSNAIIISEEPAIVSKSSHTKSRFYYDHGFSAPSSSSSYASTKQSYKEKVNFMQKGPSTVLLRLNGTKCFALFKSMNQMLDLESGTSTTNMKKENDHSITATAQSLPPEIQGVIRQQLSLPSKKFPASASLMQRASCLGSVERRSVELFREYLNDSNGRSQRTLAREALRRADEEIFSSLPEALKLTMKGYVATLPLKRKDKSYTGINGLLIPSEVSFED